VTVCSGCGGSVPFEACPTCPPRVVPCPACGESVLVEPMAQETMDMILRLREERLKNE